MPAAPTAIYSPPNWLDHLDWEQVFGNRHAVEVELGCGKGAFLAWAARTHPHINFAGVERQLRRLRKVDQKTQRLGLVNVRLLRIEAGYLVTRLIPDGSISAYHVYFPDPWPKRRHHQRRLFSAEFVEQLERTLRPNGRVHVATDHEEYHQWICRRLTESQKFREQRPLELPDEARTEFERLFLAAGKPILRSQWERLRE
jgi:tRNA (guanine-N7-)-methyltransferase